MTALENRVDFLESKIDEMSLMIMKLVESVEHQNEINRSNFNTVEWLTAGEKNDHSSN